MPNTNGWKQACTETLFCDITERAGQSENPGRKTNVSHKRSVVRMTSNYDHRFRSFSKKPSLKHPGVSCQYSVQATCWGVHTVCFQSRGLLCPNALRALRLRGPPPRPARPEPRRRTPRAASRTASGRAWLASRAWLAERGQGRRGRQPRHREGPWRPGWARRSRGL